jgi:TolA-binding protein
MKRILFLTAMLLLVLAGCHRNAKTTETQVKEAEAALFNDDMSANAEAVPDAIATFVKYAEDNAEAAEAPEYLFKAIEVSINAKQDAQQSIDLVNRLIQGYPKFDKNPVALFMLATFVYDDQLHDLEKARECYQRIMKDYPDSPFAKDAAISIEQLGVSPEELVKIFEANQE